MPVSDSPWWWSPDETPAGNTVWPIQSDRAPTKSPEIGADRIMPLVCAVAPDRSAGRISRRLDPGGAPPSGILGWLEPERDRVDAPPLVRRDGVAFAHKPVPKRGAQVPA